LQTSLFDLAFFLRSPVQYVALAGCEIGKRFRAQARFRHGGQIAAD